RLLRKLSSVSRAQRGRPFAVRVPDQADRDQARSLAIVHTGKDSRAIPLSNERISIDGSEGLTLNVTADAKFNLGPRSALLFGYASPVITREIRPDGLTRSMVMSFGLSIGFGAK